jgi:tRNA_anti-like
MRKYLSVCSGVLVLLLSSVPALAQYRGNLGGNWNDPISATITNIIMDRYAQRRLQENFAAKRPRVKTSESSPGSASAKTKLNDASLHFRSTGTQLKTQEIANLIDARNPQVFQLMTALLEEYEKNARAAGKPNDVALALSFFLATNASLYHDAGQPTDSQMLELRETIAEALLQASAFNGVTDRKKQEMYETLVLFTGFALAAYQEGKQQGNPASVRVAQQLAGQNLQSLTGVSPDETSFTDQGLSIGTEVNSTLNTDTPTQARSSQETIEHWVILREFRDNQVAAEARYNGKRVTITGPIDFVVVENGKPVVRMGVPAWSGRQMFCIFPVSQKAALAQLVPNQTVVMECTVMGDVGGVSRIRGVDLGSSVGRLTLDNCSLK